MLVEGENSIEFSFKYISREGREKVRERSEKVREGSEREWREKERRKSVRKEIRIRRKIVILFNREDTSFPWNKLLVLFMFFYGKEFIKKEEKKK